MSVAYQSLLPEVEKLLDEGLCVTLQVKGNSMLPFIQGGRDSVTLVKTLHPRRGDIVLARTGEGQYVLHRIIRTGNGSLELMGDGNCRGTEQCSLHDVCGKVVEIVTPRRRIGTDSGRMRAAVAVWQVLRPARRWLLALYRRIIMRR